MTEDKQRGVEELNTCLNSLLVPVTFRSLVTLQVPGLSFYPLPFSPSSAPCQTTHRVSNIFILRMQRWGTERFLLYIFGLLGKERILPSASQVIPSGYCLQSFGSILTEKGVQLLMDDKLF